MGGREGVLKKVGRKKKNEENLQYPPRTNR